MYSQPSHPGYAYEDEEDEETEEYEDEVDEFEVENEEDEEDEDEDDDEFQDEEIAELSSQMNGLDINGLAGLDVDNMNEQDAVELLAQLEKEQASQKDMIERVGTRAGAEHWPLSEH